MEHREDITQELIILEQKIKIFSDAEVEEVSDFVKKCSNLINNFLVKCPFEEAKGDFEQVYSLLSDILKLLEEDKFLSSFGFCLDEGNYRSHFLTKHVINGFLSVGTTGGVRGINFKENIQKFVTHCAKKIQMSLEGYREEEAKKTEEIRERNQWIRPLLCNFDQIQRSR